MSSSMSVNEQKLCMSNAITYIKKKDCCQDFWYKQSEILNREWQSYTPGFKIWMSYTFQVFNTRSIHWQTYGSEFWASHNVTECVQATVQLHGFNLKTKYCAEILCCSSAILHDSKQVSALTRALLHCCALYNFLSIKYPQPQISSNILSIKYPQIRPIVLNTNKTTLIIVFVLSYQSRRSKPRNPVLRPAVQCSGNLLLTGF